MFLCALGANLVVFVVKKKLTTKDTKDITKNTKDYII
jgi:hypothetical protein